MVPKDIKPNLFDLHHFLFYMIFIKQKKVLLNY